MTVEPTPEALAPAAAGLPHISAGQIADARSAWVSYGHAVEDFDKALAPAPADGARLAPADIQATVDGLRATGNDPEAIEAALQRHGLTAPPDARTEAEREFDATFPPPAPGSYKPNYFEHPPEDGVDLGQHNSQVQNAMAAMMIEPRVGERIAELSNDLARWHGTAAEIDRQAWRTEERYSLERRFGDDGAKLYVGLAARALARAAPEFADRLIASGAAHSAEVIRLLALNEARLSRRSA